jgi:hypothetical protein
MSNYGTSYNVNQTSDLYTTQGTTLSTGMDNYTSSHGTTVNAPVNYRKLKVFKNFDNEFFFFIKNQDRKNIHLGGLTINASFIDRQTKSILFTKKCINLDQTQGSVKLVIDIHDTPNIEPGLYDIVLSYTTSDGLTIPLYVDLNLRPAFTVEVSDEATAAPLRTQVTDGFTINAGFGYSSIINGPAFYGKPGGLITFGVYTTGYTGQFYLQGTTETSPSDNDWFDLDIGVMSQYHQFVVTTGIEPFTITSNLRHLRAKFEDTSVGTVDKLVVRV